MLIDLAPIVIGMVGTLAMAFVSGCRSENGPDDSRDSASNTPNQASHRESMPRLNEEERRVILNKGTEAPHTGKYDSHFEAGEYLCRQCGAKLYSSTSKFQSHCGWPSFDDEIPGAVFRLPDADGRRTEIVCAACNGHLGHIFEGEGYTPKNSRHCVNSVSLVFRPAKKPIIQGQHSEEAIFAGGCFWGVEHLFQEVDGVLEAESGYTGGTMKNPTYEQVCTGHTGHAEAVRVVYDPTRVSYEELAKRFFEIHDPTEKNRQGPDVGTQYRSAVFYRNPKQKQVAEALIAKLKTLGYDVATGLSPATTFYAADDDHQNYLENHPERSSCHRPVPRFDMPKR